MGDDRVTRAAGEARGGASKSSRLLSACHVPEGLDDGVLRVVAIGVGGVRLPIVDVERRIGATEDELKLSRGEHAHPSRWDHLREAAKEGVAWPAQLRVQPVVRDQEDVLEAVGRGDRKLRAVWLECHLSPRVRRQLGVDVLLEGKCECELLQLAFVSARPELRAGM